MAVDLSTLTFFGNVPDRLWLASAFATLQMVSSGPVSPITPPTHFAPRFPDTVPGPASLATTRHVGGDAPRNLAPERTQVPAFESHVDRAPLAPGLPTTEQPFATLIPLPELLTVPAYRVQPDFAPLARGLLAASQHVSSVVPLPELRFVSLYRNQPDFAPGAKMATSAQAFAPTFAPAPERTFTLAAEAHADRAPGLTVHASQQLASSPTAIVPERNFLPSFESHPDALRLPVLGAPSQLAPTSIPPKPEVSQSGMWLPGFVDIAPKPANWVSRAWSQDFQNFSPERANTPPLPLFQDSALGVRLPIAEQFAFAAPTLIERTTTAVFESHADAVSLPRLFPGSVPSVAFVVAPDRTVPLFPVVLPDAAPRALGLAAHLAVTGLAPAPERSSTLAATSFADTARGYTYPAVEQAAFAASLYPERSTVLSQPSFADAVTRPALLAASQFAAPAFAPAPETKFVLDWQPSYPPTATRPALTAAAMPVYAFAPSPIPDIPLRWQPSFPERAPGSFIGARQQRFDSSWTPLIIGVPYVIVVTLMPPTVAAGDVLDPTYPG